MNKKITLLALKCLFVLAFTQVLNAQQIYTNGGLSTGATSNNLTAAPVGYTWSELQNNVGNTTETNASTGLNGYYNNAGALNFRLADNFVVPAGTIWNTSSFEFFFYQTSFTGTIPPIDALRVQIFSSDPSLPGAVSVAGNMTTNVYDAANSSDALMYRTANSSVPTNLVPVTTRKIWKVRGNLTASLPAGTYWVVYQVHATNDLACLTPYVTVVGSRGLAGWNAKQQTVTTSVWASIIDLGNPAATAPDVPQDLPFNINGTLTAVAPANDNCSGAIALTPGVIFATNPLNSSNLNATTTAGLVPSCQTNSVNEVWYSVVVPASGNITIESQANGGMTNSIIAAYSGTCSTTLIPVGCNDDQGVNLMSKLSLTGQTPGSTLLIALSRYSLGTGVDGTFVISAYDTPPPPPANDNCSGAIALTPGGFFATNPLNSTNLNATTTVGSVASCQANIASDVWYSVVVPASGNITIEAQANGGMTNSVIVAYSGTCSTTLVPVGCNDDQGLNLMSTLSLTGQTPGSTLLIALSRYSLGTGVNGTFVISAYDTSLQPPANDNCSGAIALTPGGFFATNPLNSNNNNATTTVGSVASCQANIASDVWYSVVVPASGNITIEAQANGGMTNSVIVAYSGTCSTTLVPVGCNDDQGLNLMSKLSLTGQTPGSTLLIALSRYSLGTGVNGTFVISAYDTSLQPPANDNCSGAIALTPGGFFATNPLNSNNNNATTTVGSVASCQANIASDVWYSVVVPASGNITIEAQANGGMTNSVIVAYSGTCSTTLVPVGCNDDQGLNLMSKLSLTGQTPGSTLLIALSRYSLGTGVNGTFVISAYDTSLQPPLNDNCSGAIALTPGGVFADFPLSSNNNNATTTVGSVASCQANITSDVWYSVVVPASGNITIEAQVNGGMTDSVIVAYSGSCSTTLTPLGCDDDGGLAGANNLMSILSLTGQTPGSTILIGLWRNSSGIGVNGTFVISAYDASLSNNTFSDEKFIAYPNPVKDILNLSFSKEMSNVEVYNILGQQVIAKEINATQSQVDMSQLAPGTYMVKAFVDNQTQTIKVIKE